MRLDAITERLAWQALSRFVGESGDQNLGSTRELADMLRGYSRTEIPEAPAPRELYRFDVTTQSFSEGGTVLRRLGVDRRAVKAMWREAQLADGPRAELPRELMVALFPDELWKCAASMLLDGPFVAVRRLDHLLEAESHRRVRPTRARPEGGRLARRTLKTYSRITRMFMWHFVVLRHEGHEAELLRIWTYLPRGARVPGEQITTDRSAPHKALLRIVWRRSLAEVERQSSPETWCKRNGLISSVKLVAAQAATSWPTSS